MEVMSGTKKFTGLRSSFVMYVLGTLLLVTALSGIAIWGCATLQNALLPDSNLVYLTIQTTYADGSETTTTVPMTLDDVLKEIPQMISLEDPQGNRLTDEQNVKYSVTEIENSFAALSPKQQLAYQLSQAAMAALPILFSLTGILLCGLLFYRNKLKAPITLLSSAASQIADQNLDFQISYPAGDEMGMLCASFEQMRLTLKENNQKLWDLLEERKRLQDSVAHDLRNPLAIIQGYAQYLQMNLCSEKNHKEKLMTVADNILKTSQRLERYTDSLRAISRLEELEIRPQPVNFSLLSSEMREDLSLLTEEKGIHLDWKTAVREKELFLDAKVLYRILENLLGNAVRFAKKEIQVYFSYEQGRLAVTVADDGPGFSAKVLNNQDRYAYADSGDEEHLGMGLAICRVLCRKHGGQLILSNASSGGAVIKFNLLS